MEIQQDSKDIMPTAKQLEKFSQLIQGSFLTKTERDRIVKMIEGRLITKRDYFIVIAKLITDRAFFRHFQGRRKKKIARCVKCKNRVNIKRIENIKTGKREWICSVCWNQSNTENIIEVKKGKAVDPIMEAEAHIGPSVSNLKEQENGN